MGNISSDAAETDAHAAGVGIPRDERRIGLAADIDVHAADDGGIGAGAEHIALPGDVAFFHQVGDMDCDRGAGDARAFRKGCEIMGSASIHCRICRSRCVMGTPPKRRFIF